MGIVGKQEEVGVQRSVGLKLQQMWVPTEKALDTSQENGTQVHHCRRCGVQQVAQFLRASVFWV